MESVHVLHEFHFQYLISMLGHCQVVLSLMQPIFGSRPIYLILKKKKQKKNSTASLPSVPSPQTSPLLNSNRQKGKGCILFGLGPRVDGEVFHFGFEAIIVGYPAISLVDPLLPKRLSDTRAIKEGLTKFYKFPYEL